MRMQRSSIAVSILASVIIGLFLCWQISTGANTHQALCVQHASCPARQILSPEMTEQAFEFQPYHLLFVALPLLLVIGTHIYLELSLARPRKRQSFILLGRYRV